MKLKLFQGREEHKIKMPLAGMESKEEMMGERKKENHAGTSGEKDALGRPNLSQVL